MNREVSELQREPSIMMCAHRREFQALGCSLGVVSDARCGLLRVSAVNEVSGRGG